MKNDLAVPAEGPALAAETAAIERMARYVARSGLFGVRDEAQAVALLLLARAEGLHPMQAVREYHIIDGRPALRADAMLARFQAAGGRVRWIERTDRAAEAEFEHPAGGRVRVRWTLEDAARAGLAQRKTWKQYPRQMLTARVISEGVRTVYPAVAVGVYTPEEVADFDAEPAPEPVPVAEPEAAAEPPAQRATVVESTDREVRKNPWSALAEAVEALGLAPEVALSIARIMTGRHVESARDLTAEEARRMGEYLEAVLRADLGEEEPPRERGRYLAAAVESGELPSPDAIRADYAAWRAALAAEEVAEEEGDQAENPSDRS